MKSKKEMLRVLIAADGDRICLDTSRKKNRRDAYVRTSRRSLQKARKNKGLERSFKMSIPNEVYDALEKEFDELAAE